MLSTINFSSYTNSVAGAKSAISSIVAACKPGATAAPQTAFDTAKTSVELARAASNSILAQTSLSYAAPVPILTNSGNEAVESEQAAIRFNEILDFLAVQFATWNGKVANADILSTYIKPSQEIMVTAQTFAAPNGVIGLDNALGRLQEIHYRIHSPSPATQPWPDVPGAGISEVDKAILTLLGKICDNLGVE